MLKNLLLFSLSLLAVPMLHHPAAAQALDPTFTPPTSLYTLGAVYSMGAQQADGKRVVAGYFTRVNNTAVGSLVRLDAAGALDAAFAQNVGVARNTYRVKALPSGQYLVSSFYNEAVTAGGLTRPGLLRLDASGTADASFNAGTGAASTGLDGVQITTFVGQPDGKVLVGGDFTSFNGQSARNLVRLSATGSLDAAFATNLGTGFSNANQSGAVTSVVLQPDGKLLVSGYFNTFNGQSVPGLLRLNPDGTRDTGFTVALTQGSYVSSLTLQPDGKVLATGYLSYAGQSAGIIRLTVTGAVDSSFAPPSLNAGSGFDPSVVVQPDGKLLVSASLSGGSSPPVFRLNANGSLDTSFYAANGPAQYAYTLGLQADGSVLVGGYFTNFNGREAALGRLSSTGTLDATFAPKVQAPGIVAAVVRQTDGQLILGGDFTEYNGIAVRRVVRVSATGTLDAAYATATAALSTRVTALALQPDGKLLLGTDYGLRRLLTTGGTDASYSTYAANASITALAMQPDGQVVVAGYLPPAGGGNSDYLVRLTTTGDRDASFTMGTTNAPGQLFYLLSLALQPDGKVLVGGSYFNGSNTNLRVVRYQSTGAVDATFSSSTSFNLPASAVGYLVRLNALALQPDGKVLVGGYFTSVGGAARANLARLTATGQLDTGFVPPSTLNGAVTALALQPNGRLLVGSGFGTDGRPATTPLLRLLATGAADASFAPTATPDSEVDALLVQPNGAIVLGGSFTAVGGATSPGVARITAPNVLAVAAPASAAQLGVWPVPVHGLLHATAEADAQAAELLDALGRVVRQQALRGAGEFTLPTDGLPVGVYVLRVQYASGTATRRVAVE